MQRSHGMRLAWLLVLPVLFQFSVADASRATRKAGVGRTVVPSGEKRTRRFQPLRSYAHWRQGVKRVKHESVEKLSEGELYRRIGREQRRGGRMFALSWATGITGFLAAASTLGAFTESARHGIASLVVLGASVVGFLYSQKREVDHQARESDAWSELEDRGVQTY